MVDGELVIVSTQFRRDGGVVQRGRHGLGDGINLHPPRGGHHQWNRVRSLESRQSGGLHRSGGLHSEHHYGLAGAHPLPAGLPDQYAYHTRTTLTPT